MFPNKISVFESSDGLCIAKTGEEKEDDFRYIKVIIHDRVEATNQSQLKEIQELAAEVAEVTETARMLTVHVDDYNQRRHATPSPCTGATRTARGTRSQRGPCPPARGARCLWF